MRKIFLLVLVLFALSYSQFHPQAYSQVIPGMQESPGTHESLGEHESQSPQKSRGTVLRYRLHPTLLKTGEKGFIRIRVADNLTSSDIRRISINNNQWFHINNIEINHSENEILVWFIPFDPAITSFPEFEIGDKIYSGIPISVQSRLGNVNTLNPLGGKVLLPWTRVLFGGVFTLLVIFLFLLYYAIKVVPKKLRKTVALKSNAFKRKFLLRKMSRMIPRLNKYEKTDYIKRFIKLLKEYLEITTSKKTTCFTTREIITAFPEAPCKELIFMDSVRFGNSSADSETITETSGTVYNFALMFENVMREEAAGEKKI